MGSDDVPGFVRDEQILDTFLIAIAKLMGGLDPRRIGGGSVRAACSRIPAPFFAVVALVYWRNYEVPHGAEIFNATQWLQTNKLEMVEALAKRATELEFKYSRVDPGN